MKYTKRIKITIFLRKIKSSFWKYQALFLHRIRLASLVLLKDFNGFIWIKVDGPANHCYLVMQTNLLSLSMCRFCPLDP